MKNIRNNLLNNKRFIFPAFKFSEFVDDISCEAGEISWKLFHDVYEKDQDLQSNLKKAPKIVPLALSIFHETTSAAIISYFSECKAAADFLKVFDKWWNISNSRTRYNTNNRIGNAAE